MNLRSLLLTGAVGLAVAAPAADAQVREMRYLGTVTGTQTTTWDEPRHGSPGSDDCYHVNFTQGNGKETLSFTSQGATKVLVTRVGTGSSVSLHYGNWNPMAMGPSGIRVKVTHDRRYSLVNETEPGPCGGEAKTYADDGVDCGVRTVKGFADLDFTGGRAVLDLLSDNPFKLCALSTPEGVDEGELAKAGPKMVGADLLDPKQGLHILLGEETFQESRHVPDGGTLTATTTVRWQLRLKRVK